MSKCVDLTGQTFGRLTVIERVENYISPKGQKQSQWLCKCECGNIVKVVRSVLQNGHTRSCGCLRKEISVSANLKHGMIDTPVYKEWENMKARCYTKSSSRFNRYGARGIIVCDRWRNSFEAFYADVSILPNFGKEGYSLNRIDNDGNYEPNNVEWADKITQANNTSTNHYLTYSGKTQTIAQWAREYNIGSATLLYRVNAGWNIERALTEPAILGKNQTYTGGMM